MVKFTSLLAIALLASGSLVVADPYKDEAYLSKKGKEYNSIGKKSDGLYLMQEVVTPSSPSSSSKVVVPAPAEPTKDNVGGLSVDSEPTGDDMSDDSFDGGEVDDVNLDDDDDDDDSVDDDDDSDDDDSDDDDSDDDSDDDDDDDDDADATETDDADATETDGSGGNNPGGGGNNPRPTASGGARDGEFVIGIPGETCEQTCDNTNGQDCVPELGDQIWSINRITDLMAGFGITCDLFVQSGTESPGYIIDTSNGEITCFYGPSDDDICTTPSSTEFRICACADDPDTLPPFAPDWTLSQPGESCFDACGDLGSTCNTANQDAVTSPEHIQYVGDLLGIDCNNTLPWDTVVDPSVFSDICFYRDTSAGVGSDCNTSSPETERICCCSPDTANSCPVGPAVPVVPPQATFGGWTANPGLNPFTGPATGQANGEPDIGESTPAQSCTQVCASRGQPCTSTAATTMTTEANINGLLNVLYGRSCDTYSRFNGVPAMFTILSTGIGNNTANTVNCALATLGTEVIPGCDVVGLGGYWNLCCCSADPNSCPLL